MGVGPPHTIEEVTEGDEVMEKRGRQDGITTEQAKGRTQRWQPLLPNLQRVNEAARSSGQTRFTALLHHVDVAALERAFRRQRRAASPGTDRVTVDDYERELEANLRRLHDSVHSGQYWPKPVRRTYIPKADGGRRPLGIPALEDKIVQGAVAEVLNAVYEADFMGFSYGFRPERSPHAALAALDKALMTQRVDWVLDVDIRTFFDSVDHGWLMRMLTHRIADRRVLRLIERWLKAGLLESGRWEPVEVGTPQGSGISPILANVFLHYAVDLWVHRWRRRSAAGQVIICRYADDVRHITRRWIPFAERRGLEDMTPGPTAYLAAKAKGDCSMPSKRERSEDADDPVPQGPRDTVRTALFEPQSPAMQAYIPRHSVLRRGHHDRATRMSSLEPSTRWAMGHHPIQGGERGTYVALDTSSTTGMWDRPTRREAQGDGAAVVLRGRESRPHGEGR